VGCPYVRSRAERVKGRGEGDGGRSVGEERGGLRGRGGGKEEGGGVEGGEW